MWGNVVRRGRLQMTIWRMRIACWIPKATNTHTHTHKICNTYCLPTTQCLHERPSMLLYTYIGSLVNNFIVSIKIRIIGMQVRVLLMGNCTVRCSEFNNKNCNELRVIFCWATSWLLPFDTSGLTFSYL